MKKSFKLLSIFCVILTIVICFAGCSDKKENENESKENKVQIGKSEINFDDIAWNVDETIVDGERKTVFNFTNNSKYSIASLEIDFKEKADITESDKQTFYNSLKKEYELSDEDMADLNEDGVKMNVNTEELVKSGETSSNEDCQFESPFYDDLEDVSLYNYMAPDIATVRYLNDGKIYTAYYDFNAEKLTLENETLDAYNWSTTEIGNKIPKLEAEVLLSNSDNSESFSFYAMGVSEEQIKQYIASCQESGYTKSTDNSDSKYKIYFVAENEDGFKLQVEYLKKNSNVYVSMEAPESAE